MAAPVIPPPPPGFTLDAVPPPPPGFTLDAATPAAPPSMADTIPQAAVHDPNEPAPGSIEPSIWDKFLNATGLNQSDPIVDMWGHGLSTIVQGAPEAIGVMGHNALLQGSTGYEAVARHPLDADAAANFTRENLAQNSIQPQGESAKQLLGGLAEGFDLTPLKETLGNAALSATGSPALATVADLLPDLGAALGGGGAAPAAIERGAEALGSKALPNPHLAAIETAARDALKPVPTTHPLAPIVEQLRAADIQLRPRDLRAIQSRYGDVESVPGETRAKFENQAKLLEGRIHHNAGALNKLAQDELGVKDLTQKSLDTAEKPEIATYEMAESVIGEKGHSPELTGALADAQKSLALPKGETAGVTRTLGLLRRRASKRIASPDGKTEEMGYADRDLADKLQDAFGNDLKAAGEPQLFDEYKAARQRLAKINDVRDSTRADILDASALQRLNKRYGGDRLTGRLKLAADASEYAPEVTKHGLKTAARGGEAAPDTKEGITKGAIKAVGRGALKLSGRGVTSKSFQDSLGVPSEAKVSAYGREPAAAPASEPSQPGLDLNEVLNLTPPPGLSQSMVRPRPELSPDNLGEIMIDGESLARTPPPPLSTEGDLGVALPELMRKKPKRKP